MLLLVFSATCKKKNFFAEVSDTQGEPHAIDIVMKNFTAEGYKKNKADWNMKAAVSYVSYATAKIYMKEVLITHFSGTDETTVVNCKTGEMDRNTGDLY
jgi:hypothetical protein